SRCFGRALAMPNLTPPVTSVAAAGAYRQQILALAPAGFEPVMTLYLTEETSKDDVVAAKQSGFVSAFKLYPAGATTNSAAGVTQVENLYPLFETMQAHDMALSIHGEVTDKEVDIFDREAVFIERSLAPLVARFPNLRVVLEHITTQEAADFVAASSDKVAATITAHHLLFNRNDMLTAGGMKPIYYCLPVLKRDSHRQALVSAVISGDPSFFLGTDSAPHPRHAKENACGCAAGSYTAHAAIELYATVFDSAQALPRLESFASHFGADFYQLPRNQDEITLAREAWQAPQSLSFGKDELLPLCGGDKIDWQVVSGARHPLSDKL
ncbi:MAG: dihydroorotase, partial [Pseudomonadales bacterium]